MLVVGAVSLAVAVIVGIDLVVGSGGGGRWWTLVGSSLTAIAMISGWFNLRSIRRKRANDPEAGHTGPSPFEGPPADVCGTAQGSCPKVRGSTGHCDFGTLFSSTSRYDSVTSSRIRSASRPPPGCNVIQCFLFM